MELKQIHAGNCPNDHNKIWHKWIDSDGYFSGWMPDSVLPRDLLYVSVTTVFDLLGNHPELKEYFFQLLSEYKTENL